MPETQPASVVRNQLSQLALSSLTWGPIGDHDRPLALLLHGFPDTARTWRHLGPVLADAGYRVAAPFLRGYAPSGLAGDGSYHVAALMSDALELHAALSGDRRAVVVGHDWGALTANGLGAYAGGPFARVVSMAVPPVPALSPTAGHPRRWLRLIPNQLTLSWYTLFNQLPMVPERVFDRLVAGLWERWSPGYDATEDLRHLAESMPDAEHRSAAIGYYRAAAQQWRLPVRYRPLQPAWTRTPEVPTLHLHGADDGCLHVRWAERARQVLPPSVAVAIVPDAGHFLQLEQPGEVAERVLAFLGR